MKCVYIFQILLIPLDISLTLDLSLSFFVFSQVFLFLPGLSNRYLFTDVQAEKQEISNQRENNNSVYAAEKSSDKRSMNGGIEVNNASVINLPGLSPVKNIRNGEEEEAEVRKTKVCYLRIGHIAVLFKYFNDNLWKQQQRITIFLSRDGQPTKLIT